MNTNTFVYERESNCFVCQKVVKEVTTSLSKTLREFYAEFKEEFRLNNPALNGNHGPIYIPKPPAIEAMHRHKLDKTFA